jgi:ATP-dependent phosphofructokinase / diphosphate-dependent phosphofructokinase
LLEDKRNNSSRYAFVIASEGALWKGQSLSEWGEADAYGHKKKADIGLALAEEIRRHTGEDTISSDLTYELRGGEPDVVDSIVATTFGNIAMDLVRQGLRGRLVAVQGGKYTHTALPDPKVPPRSVDVPTMYNVERCRPHYTGKLGLPLLLTAVSG